MIEQEITIQVGESPFDTKKIKIQVPHGTKVLCTEPYVLDALALYGLGSHVEDNINRCENKEKYITKGEIILITNDKLGNRESALIDVGSKFTAFCSLQKEPKEIVDQLNVGMLIDVKVKTSSNGTITASISDAIDEVKFNEILRAIGNKSVGFNGKITELINGGYWVDLGGIKCFMPGSLAGLNKLWNFESLIGSMLVVMPVSYSNEKNTIIVSHREYLNTLIPNAVDDLNENIKDHVEGIVTGTTKFGIFAEFNKCLTGLIRNIELDEETLIRFNKNDIKPGDPISFWAKEIISDKKIILTQKGPKEDLWDNVEDKYKPMMITTGIVTKVAKYGAFVELEKGISGLIHKTKLKDVSLDKGDKVSVRIQGVNSFERKITMTLAD
jgi:small subunit ribosomal protein S1